MAGDAIRLVLVVSTVAAVLTVTSGSDPHGPRRSDPCPHGCRCLSRGGGTNRHRWHRLLAAYRARRLLYGGGRRDSGQTVLFHRPGAGRGADGREMTCLGLSNMPDHIPTDVQKLTLYGDTKSATLQQDSPAGPSYPYGDTTGAGHAQTRKSYHQLTNIAKYTFRRNKNMTELSIEGNRIKVLHPNDFDMLAGLRRLHMRNNRLKLVWVRAFRGLANLVELDLSHNHIRKLSKGLFNDVPRLRKLSLNQNRMRGIHTKLFRRLKHLEFLDLSDNFLKDLHRDLFIYNIQMKELIVDHNNLMYMRTEWFTNMKNLAKLSFRGNRILELSLPVFRNLPALKHLNLEKNEITSIPSGIFSHNNHLQTVSLAKNNISAIAEGAFRNVSYLRELYLDDNRITQLENDTFEGLKSLETLSFSKNQLLGVEAQTFNKMKHLTHLDISSNHLKVIKTRNFYGLLELRELRLDHNDIVVIENQGFAVSMVNTYSKLTWLYLHYNQIKDVTSRMFYGLSYLKFFNLCHNRIGSVHEGGLSMLGRLHTLVLNNNDINTVSPGTFKHLRHLRHLNMAGNSLNDVTFNGFLGLDNVEDLNLEDNSIREVSSATFQDTPQLVTINLKKNKLRSFDLSMLEHLTRLKYLDLGRNAISKVHMRTHHPGNLYFLSLADNHLRSLEANVTQTMTRGGSLHLYGNPWSCDCHLGWMRTVYLGSHVKLPESDDIVCKSPAELSGEEVLSLRPENLQCLVADHPSDDDPTVACSFMGHARHANTRNHVKARKTDIIDWHVTFLTTNQTSYCTGVLLSQDWVLTPSACWKFYMDNSLSLRVGERSDHNQPHSVLIDQIVHYPGSVDIAMVKIYITAGEMAARVFPCLLSERGVHQALKKGAHGIMQVQRVPPRHPERMLVKLFTYKIIKAQHKEASVVGLRGSQGRMPRNRSEMKSAPFFVKVGISRWALLGLNSQMPAGRAADTYVDTIHAAIRWIDRLIY